MHCLFCNLEDSHISQGQENILMLLWYDGPRIHPCLLDLVIISPVLALTHTHEPRYAAFKMCWYKATFVRAVFSFNKQMFSSHVYFGVGACLFYHKVL